MPVGGWIWFAFWLCMPSGNFCHHTIPSNTFSEKPKKGKYKSEFLSKHKRQYRRSASLRLLVADNRIVARESGGDEDLRTKKAWFFYLIPKLGSILCFMPSLEVKRTGNFLAGYQLRLKRPNDIRWNGDTFYKTSFHETVSAELCCTNQAAPSKLRNGLLFWLSPRHSYRYQESRNKVASQPFARHFHRQTYKTTTCLNKNRAFVVALQIFLMTLGAFSITKETNVLHKCHVYIRLFCGVNGQDEKGVESLLWIREIAEWTQRFRQSALIRSYSFCTIC